MKSKFLSRFVLPSVLACSFPAFLLSTPFCVCAEDLSDELETWLDITGELIADEIATSNTPGAVPGQYLPAFYCALQYMKYALNENPQMIHAGDTWSTLSPGYGYYYNVDGHLRGVMYPTSYPASGRYSEIMVCTSPDFTIYYTCETDNPDFSDFVYFEGWHGNNTYNYTTYIAQSLSNSSGSATFTAKCSSEYFSTIDNWKVTRTNTNTSSFSQNLYFECVGSVPTITGTYSPSFSGGWITIRLCGNYQEIDFTDLSIADIALTQLADPAQLLDYLSTEFVPSFELDNPGIALPPLPDIEEPTEPVFQPVTDDLGQPVTNSPGQNDWQYSFNVPSLPYLEIPEPPTIDASVETKPFYTSLVSSSSDLLQSSGLLPVLVVVSVIGAIIFIVG